MVFKENGLERLELCNECAINYKKFEDEYTKEYEILHEQLILLNQNFKEKINRMKGETDDKD